MKPILDLTKAIGNEKYFYNQFTKWGSEKNILFINPQLSGKCLYKMLLPFFSMYNEKISTAISGLSKYDYKSQIIGYEEIFMTDEMINWSDFIVFPFTTHPLYLEHYLRIKILKENVKIVFLVDFNFYELSDLHPFKNIFQEPKLLSSTEDNIWFSDICLTSNTELANELIKKFTELSKTKYSNMPSNLAIASMPFMIDTDIVLKNIEFEPIKPVLVNSNEHILETKKHIEEISNVAEILKQEDLSKKININNKENNIIADDYLDFNEEEFNYNKSDFNKNIIKNLKDEKSEKTNKKSIRKKRNSKSTRTNTRKKQTKNTKSKR
jgi:hypothetical protein